MWVTFLHVRRESPVWRPPPLTPRERQRRTGSRSLCAAAQAPGPGRTLTRTAPGEGAQEKPILLGLARHPERVVLGKLAVALEVHEVYPELAGSWSRKAVRCQQRDPRPGLAGGDLGAGGGAVWTRHPGLAQSWTTSADVGRAVETPCQGSCCPDMPPHAPAPGHDTTSVNSAPSPRGLGHHSQPRAGPARVPAGGRPCAPWARCVGKGGVMAGRGAHPRGLRSLCLGI